MLLSLLCVSLFVSYYFDSAIHIRSGLVRRASLRHLRTGHSHEDIDQCFGSLSKFMARFGRRCRHTGDFVAIIQQWLDQLPRSFECGRYVEKLDQYRDWSLG